MISRAKFSLGAPLTFTPASRTERLALGLREVGRGGAAGGKGLEGRIVNAGMLERLESAVVDRVVGDERRDRRQRRHPGESLDLLGRSAERRALEQVRRPFIAPV